MTETKAICPHCKKPLDHINMFYDAECRSELQLEGDGSVSFEERGRDPYLTKPETFECPYCQKPLELENEEQAIAFLQDKFIFPEPATCQYCRGPLQYLNYAESQEEYGYAAIGGDYDLEWDSRGVESDYRIQRYYCPNIACNMLLATNKEDAIAILKENKHPKIAPIYKQEIVAGFEDEQITAITGWGKITIRPKDKEIYIVQNDSNTIENADTLAPHEDSLCITIKPKEAEE